jgi:hypothetical protein
VGDVDLAEPHPTFLPLTEFSIFMASRMTTVSPDFDAPGPQRPLTFTMVPCMGTVTIRGTAADDAGVRVGGGRA